MTSETLEQRVAHCGPLWPDAALVVVLNACGRASRMPVGELAATIASLNVSHVFRSAAGDWVWTPARTSPPAASLTDADVIERLGAILYYAVTGQAPIDRYADEHAVRTRLRTLRANLPGALEDLIVVTLSAQRASPRTLETFAAEVRRLLGVARPSDRPASRRTPIVTAAGVAAIVLAATVFLTTRRSVDAVASHGLTAHETVLLDVTNETAQGFVLMEEHTAAIQEYQQIARWLAPRLPAEDPRFMWNGAHEAWVRTLRGDRLTTEQVLGTTDGATSRLEAALGDRHPYTRAARLELAATLDARGATNEASALRDRANRAARALVADPASMLPGIPAPPGVLAHLGSTMPEREGFRRRADGTFFIPVTSIQRLLAGRDGWRLHVMAAGACRASVAVGAIPRVISINAAQRTDKTWHVRVDGVTPAPEWTVDASDQIRVSLLADGHGRIEAKSMTAVRSAVVDETAPPAAPPYALAFDGGADRAGCALVWLEIPFRYEPTP